MPAHWRHDLQEQIERLDRLAKANECKHPLAAVEVHAIAANLGIISMRFSKLFAALQKENDDLKAQLAKVPPPERWLDDADMSAADVVSTRLGLDGNGDPNPVQAPPTEESLTADLKASADTLASAVKQAQ